MKWLFIWFIPLIFKPNEQNQQKEHFFCLFWRAEMNDIVIIIDRNPKK